MLLFELFNTIYPIGMIENSEDKMRMNFFDPKALVPVSFLAERFTPEKEEQIIENKNIWHIMFTRGREIEITKQGNAFKIYSTIIECIKIFVKEKQPDVILFIGSEKSKQSLYISMVKKLAPTIGFRMANGYDNDYLTSLGIPYFPERKDTFILIGNA